MDGKYTEKGELNKGYEGPSTSKSGSGRPTSGDVQVDVDTHVNKTRKAVEYDNDLDKDEDTSSVCFVCRIVCILAAIAIAIFLIVWFSVVEAGLTRNPPVGMSPTTRP